MVAAADEEDLEPYRRLPSPDWLDGNVAGHEVIGTPATTAQVIHLAFTTALIEAAVERGATLVTGVVDGLALEGPAGAVSCVSIDGRRGRPRPWCWRSAPGRARRSGGWRCSRRAREPPSRRRARGRSACVRPLTVDGLPLVGPVPGAPGAYLATAHASWGSSARRPRAG